MLTPVPSHRLVPHGILTEALRRAGSVRCEKGHTRMRRLVAAVAVALLVAP